MKWRVVILGVVLAAGWWAGCLAVCQADIVGDICARSSNQAPDFNQYLAAVRDLQASPRVAVSSVGRSALGRPLLQITVGDPDVPREQTVRVFLLARQHGTEASGTQACLALLRHFAASDGPLERDLLRQITWIAIPVVNPDGMANGRRANGAGVDLNRDWGRATQPESRAVIAAVAAARPHALVDMHDLPATSGKSAFRDNFVQTVGGSRLPDWLTRDCGATSGQVAAWMGQMGFGLNVFTDTPGEDLRLCHRYFGLGRKIPSFLFEAKSGSGRSLLSRARFHVLGALVVGNYALHRNFAPEAGSEAPQVAAAPTPALAPPTPAAPEAPTTVELQQPLDRQTARGQLAVIAHVAPSAQFAYLQVQVDGAVKALLTTAPHSFSLNTRAYSDGEHHIAVLACDDSGRVLSQDTVTVLVDNRQEAGE